jgi:hypothetical protein
LGLRFSQIITREENVRSREFWLRERYEHPCCREWLRAMSAESARWDASGADEQFQIPFSHHHWV